MHIIQHVFVNQYGVLPYMAYANEVATSLCKHPIDTQLARLSSGGGIINDRDYEFNIKNYPRVNNL